MHDDSRFVEERLERFLRERIRPAMYRALAPLQVLCWEAPDEPVPFGEAARQRYRPFAVGTAWGRPWGTTWFHLAGEIPAEWADASGTCLEAVVDLGFTVAIPGFQVEGTAYSPAGEILKGIESMNRHVPLTASPGENVDFYVEAASNPDIAQNFSFARTALGNLGTAGRAPLYTFREADAALLDLPVWELAQDIRALDGLRRELPRASSRRADILRALQRCLDAVDPENVAGTASEGRLQLAGVLERPAHASAHRLYAVGHAHIDSAWLWPVRETMRKVARTFSNVLDLVDANPDFVFAASSAQQYAWLKEEYPELFRRVKAAVESGNFVPVGGMWVESDTNMPGGEALVRQFVAGKRFFLDEFGIEPLEVWLPDSFGYSGALPQIVRAAGSRWFLTQKISWNDTNVFPHHTFLWEGIDGTRIFTHFPPVADYNSQLSGAELARAERRFAEKGAATSSLIPFGWGDGGGGPTREMLAAARRTASLEGSPTVALSSPRHFFEAAEAEYDAPPVWSGELYLEFHRGTYTSQARTKQGNRRSEHLLREAELWATTASVRHSAEYPYDALEAAWHTVLLQQFHDILPGSSIAWVHREAERNYAEVARALEGVIQSAGRALAGDGDATVLLNAGPYPVGGVRALGGMAPLTGVSAGEGSHIDPPDAREGRFGTPQGMATAQRTPAGIVLRNEWVAVTIDEDGLFSSIRDLAADRELVPAGARGNLLQLHRDTPAKWDAWDIDRSYAHTVTDGTGITALELLDAGTGIAAPAPGTAGVRVTRSFGSSTVSETITLGRDRAAIDITITVDWQERQKLLKLAFPFDLHAERAASEIQFGHVFRPTHANTSWDAARFETVAHRWVHIGEPGYGVALANDSTYGHDISRSTDAGGHPATTVRLSLLRAPVYPDPEADQGIHTFRVSLRPGAAIPDAVAEGYRLNLPLRAISHAAGTAIDPLFSVDNPAVVIEAVKLAEDRSGDVVVRLYEAHGSRARARVLCSFAPTDATETDLLERPLPAPLALLSREGPALDLELRPFQLVTLRFPR
jgi:alpha-mannosidase